MSHSWLRKLNGWLHTHAGARASVVRTATLGVERLEPRSLLSAATGAAPEMLHELFPNAIAGSQRLDVHQHDLGGEYDIETAWVDRANHPPMHDFFPPPPLATASAHRGASFVAPASTWGGTTTVIVVMIETASPKGDARPPLMAMAPPDEFANGGGLAAQLEASGRVGGDSGDNGRRMAAMAPPPEGFDAFDSKSADARVDGRWLANVAASFAGSATALNGAIAGENDGASPLVEALRVHESVLQALAARGSQLEATSGDWYLAESSDAAAREGDPASDNEAFASLEMSDLATLARVTDRQAAEVASLLERLERGRGRREAAPDASAQEGPSAEDLAALEAARAAVDAYESQGGMVLLRTGDGTDGEEFAAVDGALAALAADGEIAIDAEVGAYRAFSVGGGDLSDAAMPVFPVTAAEGKSPVSAGAPRAAEDQSAEPRQSQATLPLAAIGASILAAGRRSQPRRRRQ
jgi:hypothetical protein